MASGGASRGGLLTSGGVLSIIGGVLEVVGAGIMVRLTIATRELLTRVSPYPYPGIIWPISAGVFIFAMGIVAIIGGVSAMRRRIFGLSLAGAICCQVSSVICAVMSFFGWPSVGGVVWALAWLILGLLAIIFICLSKKEFGTGGE